MGLTHETLAESLAGSFFYEDFESPESLAENNPTITGLPGIGNGARFDGTAKYIDFKNNLNLWNRERGSFLIDFNIFSNVGNARFFSTENSNGSAYEFRSYLSGDILQIWFPHNSGSATGISTTTIDYNRRYTVLFTWSYSGGNTTVKIYLNGTLYSNVLTGYLEMPNLSLRIGAWNTNYFNGIVHNVQIFDTILDQSDALNYYNRTMYRYMDDVKLYLPFDSERQDIDHVYVNEALTDGDMEAADTAAWTSPDATLSKQTTEPRGGIRLLRVTADAGAGAKYPRANQATTVGKSYRAIGYARSDGTQTPLVHDASVLLWTGTPSTDWQDFDVTYRATGTTFQLRFAVTDPAGTEYAEFDEVSLEELVIADGNMEASDTTSWTAGSGAVLTKETGTPYQGTRCLRVKTLSGDSGSQASQAVLTTNEKYRVTGWARSDGNAFIRVHVGTANPFDLGTGTSWTYFDITTIATDGNFYLANFYSPADQDVWTEFDAVTVETLQERTLDVSGNENHAVLGKASNKPVKLATKGFYIDNDDILVDSNSDLVVGTNDFTVGAIFKRDQAMATLALLVSKGSTSAGEWMLGFSNPKRIARFYANAGSINLNWDAGSGNDKFWDDQYTTLFFVRDGDNGYLYVNGVRKASTTGITSVNLNSTKKISVGSGNEGTERNYLGEINEVVFFPNRALSSIQMRDIHLQMLERVRDV